MAEINDLDVTDASNTGRFPENQAPSSVNDGARALEGILARGLKDTVDGYIVTAGSSTVYTLAANRTISAYYDGMTQTVEWHTASGAAPTINVDAVGAKALVWPNQDAVGAGELIAGVRDLVQYDLGNDNVMILTPRPRSITLRAAQATATGTSKTETSIPAWVKEIVISIADTSTNGSSNLFIQIGDSGGIETTGYLSNAGGTGSTIGFLITTGMAAGNVWHGRIVLNLLVASTNTWVASGTMAETNTGPALVGSAGRKVLSGTLTQLLYGPANGTDAFDAGLFSVTLKG